MPKAESRDGRRTSNERAGAETSPPVPVDRVRIADPVTRALEPDVRATLLGSGAEIWTENMPSMRSVALGFWFRSGSAHEPRAMAGSAHLLEHLVFKGTARRTARQLASEIEDLGGSLDAYTAHEHTAFLVRVPDSELGTAVDVLADLAFAPRLDAADLALEKAVVLEEIARCEDTPDDLVFDLHADFLYDGHPYGRRILGTADSVAGLDVDDLRELHSRFCGSSGLVVAAAGRVNHAELLSLLADRLPAESPRTRAGVEPPASLRSGLSRVTRPGGRQAHIVAGGPGVAVGHELRNAVVLVGTALGGGMGSRLFQRIREQLGLAYAVYAFQAFYLEAGHVGAYLGTRLETADHAREALMAELLDLAVYGLGEDELAAMKTQMKGQVVLALESPGARMNRLASLALSGEDYRSVGEVMGRIDAIGMDAAAAAAELYHPDGLAVLELYPA